ncbi:isochorismatase hydrolase [Phlyctema vagabunda]|uniref:Isochorismatase hydrolase n=1 Tax=Phlyctema vagabunda TaxID=108571 RepID=A0ABR4PPR3_9HELO
MPASESLTFGPASREWQYSRNDDNAGSKGGTFNLASKSAEKHFKFKTGVPDDVPAPKTLGLGDVDLVVDPAATALVIVDMQNFFLDARCRAHPKGLDAVGPTIEVIKKCREVGVQVIWLNWGLTDTDLETMPAGVQRSSMPHTNPRCGLGVELGDGQGRTLCAGAWNADIYSELKGHVDGARDAQCAKNRMSGLWDPAQPLFTTLVQRGVTTLLFAGVNTDQCVLGTLVDAHNRGWDCVVVEDACATTTPGGREVTFLNAAAYYGFVTDSKQFCAGTMGA